MVFKRLSKRIAARSRKHRSMKWGIRRRARFLNRKGARVRSNDLATQDGTVDEMKPLLANIVDQLPSSHLKSSPLTAPSTKEPRRITVPRTPNIDNDGPPPPMPTPPPLPIGSRPPSPTSHARLPHVCISFSYRAPLGPGRGAGRLFTANSNEEAPPPPQEPRGVRFQSTIQITEIPSHIHYTKQVRESMWSSPSELARNERRNRHEFAADGRDWRSCKEEDEFVVWTPTGKLLHPATHERLYQRAVVKKKLAEAKRNIALVLGQPTQTRYPGSLRLPSHGKKKGHVRHWSL